MSTLIVRHSKRSIYIIVLTLLLVPTCICTYSTLSPTCMAHIHAVHRTTIIMLIYFLYLCLYNSLEVGGRIIVCWVGGSSVGSFAHSRVGQRWKV